MEMIAIDTLGKLHHHGHGMVGWCSDCGSPSRYWNDVKARRAPKAAMFDIVLAALIRDRGRTAILLAASLSRARAAAQQRQRRELSR